MMSPRGECSRGPRCNAVARLRESLFFASAPEDTCSMRSGFAMHIAARSHGRQTSRTPSRKMGLGGSAGFSKSATRSDGGFLSQVRGMIAALGSSPQRNRILFLAGALIAVVGATAYALSLIHI